jgi:molybdopterin-guanine dinucleotide biosynthesis protein A
MRRPPTTAAIVAGGRARRFGGQDKSRLLVEGRSIIVRQVAVLQPLASEILVIAPDAQRFSDVPVRVVADRISGIGAVGGIDAALHASTTQLTLVVASDMPWLSRPLLAHLADRACDGRDGAWVRTKSGVEPLVACYRADARQRVAAFIDAGGRRARDLATVLDMAVVGRDHLSSFGDPDRLLANINTPDDYARIQYDSA